MTTNLDALQTDYYCNILTKEPCKPWHWIRNMVTDYNLLHRSQRLKALKYIYSVMFQHDVTFCLFRPNIGICDILSYEMVSLPSELQHVFESLNNIKNITSDNIKNFISLWKILRHNSLNIQYILSHSKLWRPLFAFVMQTLGNHDGMQHDKHNLKYNQIADLWHVLIDTVIYWKQKHYVAANSKKCLLSSCYALICIEYWDWKKSEMYEACISTNLTVFNSISTYLNSEWIIRGIAQIYGTIAYLACLQDVKCN
eukprot:479337_1